MKKFVFILWIAAILGLGLARLAPWSAAAAVGLFAWLAYETQRRRRFRFLAGSKAKETIITLTPDLHLGLASQASEHVLLVEHGPRLSVADFNSGVIEWQRAFEKAPQAVLGGQDGRFYYATDDELVLCDAKGRDSARLAFEPPLFRQSYALRLSSDGGTLILHTPWFIQFADPDLAFLGPRIRYEDAGHYLKYAALSADGKGLLVAGALLLDDAEENGAGIEARWDYWTCAADGQWSQVWARSYESYNNSHLRGVAIAGDTLLAEVYQKGYEFRLYHPDGTPIWERPGGERAQLSPGGELLLWQNAFDEILLSDVRDKEALWTRKIEGKLRLKAVDDEGRVFLIEGPRLRVLDKAGATLWEDRFWHDPDQFSLGRGGRLALVYGDKAGFLRVPFDR